MLYTETVVLSDSQFKRLTGVSRPVFNLMVNSVNEAVAARLTKRGNISKFSVEDQILIMLEYYREYRTYYHMASTYKVHESSIARIVNKTEAILIKDKRFNLPGKKVLESGSGIQISAIIVDATEIAIQRPKKSKN